MNNPKKEIDEEEPENHPVIDKSININNEEEIIIDKDNIDANNP